MKHNLSTQLIEHIQAGYTAFYVQTAETTRFDRIIAEVKQQLGFKVVEYHPSYGKIDFDNKSVDENSDVSLAKLLDHLRNEDLEQTLIVIKSAKLSLEQGSQALARLHYFIELLTRAYAGECAIILQSPVVDIPAGIEPFITLFTLPLPTANEIKQLLQGYTPDTDLTDRLCTALSGLNELEIKQLMQRIKNRFSTLSLEKQSDILQAIQHQKEQIIAKSGVLEMVSVENNVDDIGGLENLKNWLKDQSYILNHFSQAQAFGVKAPKGALIAGMPGCGKSLAAKATAQLFQQPLLRLDIGSLLGKYVGESETNMRRALMMAESISPCVLWVDELEKAFVGMSGNNASEVSSRLLGYFLTWLQEKTAPVFILATANDITALPPELLRKGRFDEIFYVGFPNKKEREQILRIHLQKLKQDPQHFSLGQLASLCRDYSGADIQNALHSAVANAFVKQQRTVTNEDIQQAIKATVPLRKTLKEKVAEYEKKFDELYLTPASVDDGMSIAQMNKLAKDPNYLNRLKVAEAEETPEELLAELARDKHIEVRKVVFTNPSCSTTILDKQLSLKPNEQYYDEELRKTALLHSNTSFNLCLDTMNENNLSDDKFLQKLSSFPLDTVECEYIESQLEKLSPTLIQALERNKSINEPTHQLVLTKHPEEGKRKLLAENPNIVQEAQLILAKDSNYDVKEVLANNPNIVKEVQLILAENNDYDVRKALASNPNIVQEAQLILIKDGNYYDVRKALANNPNIVQEAQLILAKDSWEICRNLANNPNIIQEVQLILAENNDYDVRKALASNPNIVPKVQLILSKDDGIYSINVRGVLARNPSIIKEVQLILAKDDYISVREDLAGNPSIIKEVQLILAKDNYIGVRKDLARNPSIIKEVQLILAKDDYISVREDLAGNPNIYRKAQLILAKDSDTNVKQKLASNPNITKESQTLLKENTSIN